MKMFFLLLLCIIGQIGSTAAASEQILDTANTKYNSGEFGPEETCPEGTFAFGFQIKIEQEHRPKDAQDTALNGIRLHCANISFPNRLVGSVESSSGTKGGWLASRYCDQGFVTGFRVKYGDRSDGLALAATNIELFCSNMVEIEGDGLNVGQYDDKLSCRRTLAICSIQTQVNNAESSGGINNVKMKCCQTPNPAESCSASDRWEDVLVCDNIAAAAKSPPLLCRYRQSIGVSESNIQTSTKNEEREVQNSLGYTAGISIGPISMGITEQIETSDVTGTDWEQESESTFETETVVSTFVEVPSGTRVVLRQAVASCGLYQVSATEIQKIEETLKIY